MVKVPATTNAVEHKNKDFSDTLKCIKLVMISVYNMLIK